MNATTIVIRRADPCGEVLVRDADGACQPLAHVVRHSPTGFEWGYGGSGPADLALSILTHWFGAETADAFYQAFKWSFIAKLPPAGGELHRADAEKWIADARRQHADQAHRTFAAELPDRGAELPG